MKPTPPQMKGWPIIGNIPDFLGDMNAFMERGSRELGPVFAFQLANRKFAALAGEEAQEVFFEKTDGALRMDKAYQTLRMMFGDIAFTAPPEVYQAQRHILHAPFKGGKMPGYVRIMQLEIEEWLDSLGDSGEIDLTASIAPIVQNVAAHAIMGEDFRRRIGREFWDLYFDLNKGLDFIFPPNWPLPKFRKRDQAKARMHAIIKPIIAERRASPEAHDDMLQDFCLATYKDGRPVEDEIIVGLITALMFAGHETTVGQASWTLIEIMRHPEFRAQVEAEIAAHLTAGQPIDMTTMGKLHLTALAVAETTRLHPSANVIARYVEEEIELSNYRIPAGWTVMLSAHNAHRLEDVWSNPLEFDPMRFAPGREEDKAHKHTIVGFGGGMHKCTGMNFANNEMLLFVALFLQRFEAELVNPSPGITFSFGASRPDQALVRYRKR